MKDYIICTIDNFSYSGSEELRLLNFKYSKPTSIQQLSSLFNNHKFWNSAGSNYKLSLTYTHFFYADDKFSNREDASAKATLILSQLHEFLFFLWFVKDCSCYSIQTVAYLSDKDLLLTANIPAVLSMADGKLKQQVFSDGELAYTSNILKTFAEKIGFGTTPNDQKEYNYSEYSYHQINAPHYGKLNRINRAHNFLKSARQSSSTIEKITFYTLLLECLFSTSEGSEITFKIALRASSYISKDLDEREKLFDYITSCYNLRSRYLHGDELDQKKYPDQVLVDTSTELDKIARKIFTRVILKDSSKFFQGEKQLEAYFRTLVLRPTSTQTPPSTAE